MTSLRRELIDALGDDGWDTNIRAAKQMGGREDGWRFRHDLLVRETQPHGQGKFELELLLLVVSDHPSRRLALNMKTWYHALEQRSHPSGVKARRRKMRVVLAQDSFQLTISAMELQERLKHIYPVERKSKPADTYWPLSVAVS